MNRFVLRRQLLCKYSSHRKTESSKRSTDCKAEIDIHIKLVNKNILIILFENYIFCNLQITSSTKKSDKFLRSTNGQVARPAVIKVKGKHSHHQWCADALRRNRLGADAKRQIMDLFDDGFSPAQAKRFISDKMLTDEKIVDLADNKKNPTTNTLHHQHKMWSQKNFGADPLNPFDKVNEKIDSGYYRDRGTIIIFFNIIYLSVKLF